MTPDDGDHNIADSLTGRVGDRGASSSSIACGTYMRDSHSSPTYSIKIQNAVPLPPTDNGTALC
jgi:hypothetical protein